jgi:hypothetical protein
MHISQLPSPLTEEEFDHINELVQKQTSKSLTKVYGEDGSGQVVGLDPFRLELATHHD